MTHPYTTQVTRNAKGYIVKGELFENGLLVATFKRGATEVWFKVKFFSSRAEARFDDFTDSLSRTETIEAISE